MNEYLMAIRHYFSGYEQFTIEADDKDDALVKAKEYVKHTSHFGGGNYDFNSIVCVKKINKKKKKKKYVDDKHYNGLIGID